MIKKYFQNLMIEPTSVCNLRCPICPTGYYYGRLDRGSMSFEQFKKIVQPVKKFLRAICFSGYGEPFLAEDIAKMIDYSGEKGFSVDVFTNGNFLTKEIKNALSKNWKVKLHFAIDGASQKSYGYYRRGGRLNRVLDNLANLVALKRKKNLFNLKIIWQFLILKNNEHEVEKIYKLAKQKGTDMLRIKTLNVNIDHPMRADFLAKNRSYRRNENERTDCLAVKPGMPFIFRNGDVVPCYVDYKKEHVMGNAIEDRLLLIWNRRKYKMFRKEQESGMNRFCYKKCRSLSPKKIIGEFKFQPNQ